MRTENDKPVSAPGVTVQRVVMPHRVKLETIKRRPTLPDELRGKEILIWSAEWDAWWRPNGCGYTCDRGQAGRWINLEAALEASRHASAEKRIQYEAA